MTVEFAFALSLPRKIVFGWNRAIEAPSHILPLGRRVLLVTGRASHAEGGATARLVRLLREQGGDVLEWTGPGREPEVGDVDALVTEAARWRPEVVVGCGGGSVLDLAKAAAALLPNAGGRSCAAFLEGTGTTLPIREDPLPFVAMPTTAGTGSEVTKNAVISWPEEHLKRSLRDERMVADVAIVDPALTVTVPRGVTASSGMDALTQLIESYISRGAHPVTDALCMSAIPRAFRALPRVCEDPTDREARTDMAYAALVSGICLANAGLGVAHGIAPALGLLHGVPHGKACAVLLPFALEVNRTVAQAKLAAVWRSLEKAAGDDEEAVDLLIKRVRGMCTSFGIPLTLGPLGVTTAELSELCRYASGNSLGANPRLLTKQEVAELLESYV